MKERARIGATAYSYALRLYARWVCTSAIPFGFTDESRRTAHYQRYDFPVHDRDGRAPAREQN